MDKEHSMLEARILQRQGKTQAEIAELLGVCERTVRNHLKAMPAARKLPIRGSKVDAFKATIDGILDANPSHNGELIYETLQKLGYSGKISVMKDYVASIRRKLQNQAVIRFETEPGHQAQVDWKEFGMQTVDGRATKLSAFVMVLGYSRKAFVHFTTKMDSATLQACHALAFAYFGGVPHEILYDNMRTAFQPDSDNVWRPTKKLLALAVHYGFAPKRCRVRRPETKGKVERTIGYLDNNFWPRMDAVTLSLAGLNDQVRGWLAMVDAKRLSVFEESRDDRFAREQPMLQALSLLPFDSRRDIPVLVSRESLILHETNSYSVPPQHIGTLLTLKVHPFESTAEVFGPGGSIRRFLLSPNGAKIRTFFPEDREAIRKRWDADRSRMARVRKPRSARIRMLQPEVEVRPTSAYEALFSPATMAVTA
jgi:transposase